MRSFFIAFSFDKMLHNQVEIEVRSLAIQDTSRYIVHV